MNKQIKQANDERFSDEILWAYWQGEVDTATAAKIENDPELWARARAVLHAYQQNRQPLSPPATVAEAVSDEEIGAYHLGLLPPERAREVEIYLKRNPGRAVELQVLDNYLAELEDELPSVQSLAEVADPARSLLEQIVESVRVLVARPVAASPTNGFALLGNEQERWLYEVEGAQIFLNVQDDAEIPGRKALYGLVNGIELEGLKVRVWPSRERAKSVETDVATFGNFLIPKLEPATYELCLVRSQVEIRIHDVKV